MSTIMNFILSVLVFLALSQTSAFWIEPRETVACTEKGLQCSGDCKNVTYCDGKQSLSIMECDAPTFCEYDSSGIPQCTGKTCSSMKPNCYEEGAIPSPVDCKISYVCTGGVPVEIPCPEDMHFDLDENKCVAGECSRSEVECAQPGDFGEIDSTFCYYCDKYSYPQPIKCSTSGLPLAETTEDPPESDVPSSSTDGTPSSTDVPSSSTDGTPSSTDVTSSSTDVTSSSTDVPSSSTDGTPSSTDVTSSSTDVPSSSTDVTSSSTDVTSSSTDVPSSSTDVPSSSTETPSSTDVTSSSTDVTSSSTDVPSSSTETPTTTAPPICLAVGQKFPYPGDCYSYYYCNRKNSAPIRVVCPTGYHYEQKAYNCVAGACGNDTVTTTAAPGTMTCNMVGEKFPNPEFCEKYFYCNAKNKPPINATCPTGRCYDENVYNCILGTCEGTVCTPTALFDEM